MRLYYIYNKFPYIIISITKFAKSKKYILPVNIDQTVKSRSMFNLNLKIKMEKNNSLNPEELLDIKGGAAENITVICSVKDSGYIASQEIK